MKKILMAVVIMCMLAIWATPAQADEEIYFTTMCNPQDGETVELGADTLESLDEKVQDKRNHGWVHGDECKIDSDTPFGESYTVPHQPNHPEPPVCQFVERVGLYKMSNTKYWYADGNCIERVYPFQNREK